jgi:hypothetical protein
LPCGKTTSSATPSSPGAAVFFDVTEAGDGVRYGKRQDEVYAAIGVCLPRDNQGEATAMRLWLAVVFCALLGWGPAWAVCAGPPHDEFDFWLGAWHDPAEPAAEHYAVRRTAGGCAIEEVLTGGNGQIQGIGAALGDHDRGGVGVCETPALPTRPQ